MRDFVNGCNESIIKSLVSHEKLTTGNIEFAFHEALRKTSFFYSNFKYYNFELIKFENYIIQWFKSK